MTEERPVTLKLFQDISVLHGSVLLVLVLVVVHGPHIVERLCVCVCVCVCMCVCVYVCVCVCVCVCV
jgi:hypothetical protein